LSRHVSVLPVSVGVVDCGIANLGSIFRTLSQNVRQVRVITGPTDFDGLDRIILPGVGAFAVAMARLESQQLVAALMNSVLNENIPLLGICLGMQLLATTGNEFGENPGLNLIPGVVDLLETQSSDFQIPHIGWNGIQIHQNNQLLEGIENDTDFYFVHSYRFNLQNRDNLIASTSHGVDFPSVIANGKIYGTQFHPEKSSKAGLRIIRNFCEVK
jgi:glutamine amidotransferase